MIEFINVSKSYSGTQVVNSLTANVASGRVTGLLGPNGAGKTTSLRMLLGLTRPDSGEVLIGGHAYHKIKSPMVAIGAALEITAFHPRRSALNHLRANGALIGASKSHLLALLERVGLSHAKNMSVGKFSVGMKQRLALATALLGEPRCLVLDEPMNGLDPEGILWLRGFMKDFSSRGGTVLVSSHLLREAEPIVDDILLIQQGNTLFNGPVDELLSDTGARSLEEAFMTKAMANGAQR